LFSGIIETTGRVIQALDRSGVLQISIEKPQGFSDLNIGDSIACDGVCLTLEAFDAKSMQFALGPETLRVTGWTIESVTGRAMNLERSLRLGDRLHGHLVTGHVDQRSRVVEALSAGETLALSIAIPESLNEYIWSKGSIAVNGVSLTINQVTAQTFQVGLIPETLKRTNLSELKCGDDVNLEADNMARGLVHFARLKVGER
jgi:riboflavin synthase